MDTCACGATLAANADWCPRCLAPRATPAAPAPVAVSAIFGGTAPVEAPVATLTPPTNPPKTGRFAKTEVSFGLPGRIVLTIVLFIPLVWFIYLAKEFIGVGGLVLWGGVVMPWALRDLWRHPGKR